MAIEDIETPHMDPEVRQKIADDANLLAEKKEEVLAACQVALSEEETEFAFDDCAEINRLVGVQAVELDATQYVGHIKIIDAVTWYLADKLNAIPDRSADYSPAEVKERVRALALPGNPLSKAEAMIWFEEEVFEHLPNYAVAGRPTWLFETDDGDARALFGSSGGPTLPCRLGLPEPKLWGEPPYVYPRGLEFVGFAFSGDALAGPKRPTALDGNYDSVKKIWIIGGRTKPLPHGPEDMQLLGGLKEVVAEPPLLSNAISNVYVFEN
ncbi:MAG: hypothetical protein ACSHWZ_12830 [Sulfitobacter sp.]